MAATALSRITAATLLALTVSVGHSAPYTPPADDNAPVEWPAEPRAAFALAYAIVDAASVDLERCDIAIRVGSLGRPESKDACIRSVYYGSANSRGQQAEQKMLALLKDPQSRAEIDVADIERAVAKLRTATRHFQFIRERLLRTLPN